MPRTLKDAKLDTRSARLRLAERREPYWRSISDGLAIGYRRGAKGGTWIARHYDAQHGRRFNSLGTADDIVDADGHHVLNFGQAQAAARSWFAALARGDSGVAVEPYTVADAMADYMLDYKRRGGKAADRMQIAIKAHIFPELGHVLVRNLSRRQLEQWHAKLAETPPRRRTAKGQEQQYAPLDASPEAVRRRRSTANRLLNILKAALNLAREHQRVETDAAWLSVKRFREADAPRIRYLDDDESRRLINACAPDFRLLVTAALLTGCRYGELREMTVDAYSRESGTVYVPRSKSGKERYVYLSAEGVEFFEALTAGRARHETMLRRANGSPWHRTAQIFPMRGACKAAGIAPAVSFHILRHTYGSRLAIGGVASAVIAAQLGHADTSVTEKHYAHLRPSYVADTVRAAFTPIGIVEAPKVVAIRG